MLQQYSDVVRWTLLVAGGYECQEQEGNYMIAYHSPGAALEWALLLQEALMEVNWSNEVYCGVPNTSCSFMLEAAWQGPSVC